MARHRAPDVAWTLHDVHPTGTGRARHAVAPKQASRADAQPYAEVVAWAGFASLVAAGVVGAGQGPREQAIWTLGVLGSVLSTAGLGWLAMLRRRGRRDPEHPQ